MLASAGAAAFLGALSGPPVQLVLSGAGGAVGLLLLGATVLPLSSTIRTVGMVVLGVLALGLLGGGAMMSVPAEVLLFELVGALLAFCAAVFPMLVKLVK